MIPIMLDDLSDIHELNREAEELIKTLNHESVLTAHRATLAHRASQIEWTPTAIVATMSAVLCDCGATHKTDVQLFVKFTGKHATRLRAVSRRNLPNTLPTEIQQSEQLVEQCPMCINKLLAS